MYRGTCVPPMHICAILHTIIIKFLKKKISHLLHLFTLSCFSRAESDNRHFFTLFLMLPFKLSCCIITKYIHMKFIPLNTSISESFTGRHPGPAHHLTAHVSKCVAGRREREREVEWCVHRGARQNWRCNSNEEPADVSDLHCHLSPW